MFDTSNVQPGTDIMITALVPTRSPNTTMPCLTSAWSADLTTNVHAPIRSYGNEASTPRPPHGAFHQQPTNDVLHTADNVASRLGDVSTPSPVYGQYPAGPGSCASSSVFTSRSISMATYDSMLAQTVPSESWGNSDDWSTHTSTPGWTPSHASQEPVWNGFESEAGEAVATGQIPYVVKEE